MMSKQLYTLSFTLCPYPKTALEFGLSHKEHPMTKHQIKEYLMYELVDNGILDEVIETNFQKQVYDTLKYNAYQYWHATDWTADWRIIWEYGEGPGIFYGTDAEFNELTQWIDKEIQSLISNDM